MPSSYKTPNLGLNQWRGEDRPKKDDFNRDNQIIDSLPVSAAPEQRRLTFRGKNLGSSFTATQKASIENGTFEDLYLGDYWDINGVNWRIVDFNYWLNSGDTSFTKQHLVIMPDAPLYTAQMNETDITTGGYVGSKMYTANLVQAKSMATAVFGNAVLSHREMLTNAVTNGYPSAGAWYDSTLEIPDEVMMYGSYVFTPGSTGTVTPYRYNINKTQLALMAVVPRFINHHRQNIWLRDVVTAASFARVGSYGLTTYSSASTANGVRPIFPVG